jgi:hypothetical protein
MKLLALAALAVLWIPIATEAGEGVSLRGTLHVEAAGSVLETGQRRVPLQSRDRSLAATLGDRRLAGKEVELGGEYRPDGGFGVRDLHVVSSGRLFRVIYFCTICSTLAFAPGECPCCQQALEPTEVLPSDPRVAVEELAPTRSGR